MSLAKKSNFLKVLTIIVILFIAATAVCENLTYFRYYKAQNDFAATESKSMEGFQQVLDLNETWLTLEKALIWASPVAALILFLCAAVFGQGTQTALVKSGLAVLIVNLACIVFDMAVFGFNGFAIGTYFLLPLLRGSLLRSALAWLCCLVLTGIIKAVRKVIKKK